jgi:hypothetical protein
MRFTCALRISETHFKTGIPNNQRLFQPLNCQCQWHCHLGKKKKPRTSSSYISMLGNKITWCEFSGFQRGVVEFLVFLGYFNPFRDRYIKQQTSCDRGQHLRRKKTTSTRHLGVFIIYNTEKGISIFKTEYSYIKISFSISIYFFMRYVCDAMRFIDKRPVKHNSAAIFKARAERGISNSEKQCWIEQINLLNPSGNFTYDQVSH